jgi:hypothetical protein
MVHFTSTKMADLEFPKYSMSLTTCVFRMD